jgi:hypothetical protein
MEVRMTVPKQVRQRTGRWRLSSAAAVILAVQLGAFVRLAFVLGSSFPRNDGGMFYVMVQDLLRSRFALPVYTTYNSLQVPFS